MALPFLSRRGRPLAEEEAALMNDSNQDPGPFPWEELLSSAGEAAARAYAPFSRFPVGAALLCAGGEIFPGCNVENSSYPLGICAERVALFSAVASGKREFRALALKIPGRRISTPCGACRQVLSEFCEDLPILVEAGETGERRLFRLAALLPHPFTLEP